jgi:glutamate-1-semialdehyde 2,1-aminomutase
VHPGLQWPAEDAALKAKLTTLYVQEMAKRGCHGYASFYLNAAQGEAELAQTVDAAREVFALMRDGLARGNIDALLECDLTQDAFRRMVR